VPVPFSVPPVTVDSAAFSNGNRFAGHHRFVNRGRSLDNLAVDGHALTGSDSQTVARLHVLERDVAL
jgi:hypothetical protein